MVTLPDRQPRIHSTGCFETYTLFAEPLATRESVAARDPLSYRSICSPRKREGRKTNDSIDPRMPVLASVHHFDAQKLDPDIQQEQGLGSVEFTTSQSCASGSQSRHAPGQGDPRVR